MSKERLISLVSNARGVSKLEAERWINTVSEAIQTVVMDEGLSIRLSPLGRFRRVDRAERMGKHPVTGDPVTIPAKRAIGFRPSKGG